MCLTYLTYTFLVFLREDLTNLPHLTMVIKEIMRFHSPVHFFHRVLSKDTVIDRKIAPAGTAVNLHHNSLLWPNYMVKVQSRKLYTYNLHHNPLLWPNSMIKVQSRKLYTYNLHHNPPLWPNSVVKVQSCKLYTYYLHPNPPLWP
ncbi:hypothetical protein RRG08_028388 [Elysia crispata]|uniref:Uncharacterized protein n=1 Tax=Elysia crispata TaxID=231223 RepID=A0AAE1AVR7_9GAST|nr:hypothetical protein RRG08_028388 [Elysia crispata]